MGLWEATHGSATNKPKFAVDDENSDYARENIYATNSGWVRKAGTPANGNDNASAQAEVLVAIGGLAGVSATTGLRTPTVTDVRYVVGTTANTDLTANDASAQVEVEVTWDEAVTVVGSPTIVVANGNQSSGGYGNLTLTYLATGSTANRKRFIVTSAGIGNTDVLTIGAAPIVLAGGSTISDTAVGGTTVAASLVLSGHAVAVTVAS
jgi:hypothetical protein